ncbi:MAG: DUF4838 domain-containing protein [Armatimonadota bacterium]|nr:DUF4838 domain-containing protein [Armatimonadota bacterium]
MNTSRCRAVFPSLLAAAALAFAPSVCFAAQGPAIVVHYAPYPSAAAAAEAEQQVQWHDADPRDETTCTEAFAAVELRHHLLRLAGRTHAGAAPYPIVDDAAPPAGDLIVIGGPHTNAVTARYAARLGPLEPLGTEGYRVRTVDDGGRRLVFLAGGARVGTLYAVYDFLHRLGVRWHAPGDAHTEVPFAPLTRLPSMDVAEAPAFQTRGFWAWEDRGNRDFFLWMARNRMNFWCVEDKNPAFLKKIGLQLTCGGHHHLWRFLNPTAPYPYNHPNFPGDDQKPRDPYRRGEYLGDANGDGVLSYSEAHPDWYGLQGGRRSFRITYDGGDNFCTSNDDAVTELMKNLVHDLEQGSWRWADSVNFWMLDGGRWCTCDACKRLGTPTDRNLLLVHRLRQEIRRAREIGRLNRDVKVMFLAYADVIEPPTRPLPDGFDYAGCLATFFPIGRCFAHTLNDPSCTEFNAPYVKLLHGWAADPARLYRGQLVIGEYYNVSGFKCLPALHTRVIASDVPAYYQRGARHFHYMHVPTGFWGPRALTHSLLAHLLWNPAANVEAIRRDYFTTRYGTAAAEMRAFYDDLETALCNIRAWKYGLVRRLESGQSDLFPSKHLKYEETHPENNDAPDVVQTLALLRRCGTRLQRTTRLPLGKRHQARLAEDAAVFTYADRTFRFYDALIRTHWAVHRADLTAARAAFAEARQLAEALRADTQSARWASSHANARNAFEASGAVRAYARLQAACGDTAQVHTLNLDGPPLHLAGELLTGGAASVIGTSLNVSGRQLSQQANVMYAHSQTPYDQLRLRFRLEGAPRDARVVLTGAKAGVEGGPVGMRLEVNGEEVFAGPAPFPEAALGEVSFVVPARLLRPGENGLLLANTEVDGPLGNRPWIGIHAVEIRAGDTR